MHMQLDSKILRILKLCGGFLNFKGEKVIVNLEARCYNSSIYILKGKRDKITYEKRRF